MQPTPNCIFDPAPPITPGVKERITIYGAYDVWVNQTDFDNFDPDVGVYAKNLVGDDVPCIATLVSSEPGVKTYEYMATSNGVTVTKIRKVYLWGNPVIYAPSHVIWQGDHANVMEDVTATDFAGEDITNQVRWSGDYDESVPGDYTITYTVTSHGFSDTTTSTLTVMPWAPPVIVAPALTEIELHEPFDPMYDVTATDYDGTDITADVQHSGRYDVDHPGTYTIIYTVTDIHGRTSTATQRLVVKPDPYATYLFADGTLIINGLKEELDNYRALHGALVGEYEGGPYNFTNHSQQPWYSKRTQVKHAEFGSPYSHTTVSYLLAQLENMETVDLTNLDTSNTTDLSYLFYYDFKLKEIDSNSLDVTNGINFSGMFLDCWALTELDCTSWDTSNGTNFIAMFWDCVHLHTIYATPAFVTPQDSYFTNNMFGICQSLSGGNGTEYTSNYINYTRAYVDGYLDHPGYFTDKTALVSTLYKDGTLVINEPSTQRQANIAQHGVVVRQYAPTSAENNWEAQWANDTRIKKAEFATPVEPTSMDRWFQGCSNLKEIDWTNVDSSNCTSMASLLDSCSSLEECDLSALDTSNVENFAGIFRQMRPFAGFMDYVNNWDTSSGTSFASMFAGMKGLNEIKPTFDTSNGTNFNNMFGYADFRVVDITGIDLSNAEMTHFMFGVMQYLTTIKSYCPFELPPGCATLNMFTNSTRLVGGKGTTYSVTDGAYAKCDGGPSDPGYFTRVYQGRVTTIFSDRTLIINEDMADREANIAAHGHVVGEYDPPPYNYTTHGQQEWPSYGPDRIEFGPGTKPTNLDYWLSSHAYAREVDFTNLDTSECTSMRGMCMNMEKIQTMDMSRFDTSNVTDMSSMFNGCHYLNDIRLFRNTSNVTDFSRMFEDCWYIQTIPGVSTFDTSSATALFYMFANCRDLRGVSINRWDVSNVTNFQGIFFHCQSMADVLLDRWDVSNARTMAQMFEGCYALTDIRMSTIGWVCPNLTNAEEMFKSCTNMKYINLASFAPNARWNSRSMFNNCQRLLKILAHDWNVFPSDDMFVGCYSIEGGQGTTYSSAAIDGTMARLDDPDNGRRGYFSSWV